QNAPALLDLLRERVDVLIRRNHQRESLALDAIPALRAIVLTDEQPYGASSQRHRSQLSITLMFPVNGEAHHVLVPRQALPEVFHRQGRREHEAAKRLRLS